MPGWDFNNYGRDNILWDASLRYSSSSTIGSVMLSFTDVGGDFDLMSFGASLLWRNLVTGAISDWLATTNGGWVINDANAYIATS